MRVLIAVLLVVMLSSCAGTWERHPRLTMVAGSTAVGAVVFGLPLASNCIPAPDRGCGVRHDAPIVGAAAVGGALFGIWLQYMWAKHMREPVEPPKPTFTTTRH